MMSHCGAAKVEPALATPLLRRTGSVQMNERVVFFTSGTLGFLKGTMFRALTLTLTTGNRRMWNHPKRT